MRVRANSGCGVGKSPGNENKSMWAGGSMTV